MRGKSGAETAIVAPRGSASNVNASGSGQLAASASPSAANTRAEVSGIMGADTDAQTLSRLSAVRVTQADRARSVAKLDHGAVATDLGR